jgi:peptidoglycan/LPS O-acetylase OafA/YrhL
VKALERDELVPVTSIRGLAALAVTWFHVAKWSGDFPGWSYLFGVHGPQVFFIISGFVVPWALWRAGYRWSAGFRFFAKRLVRLEPPYFATIALVIFIEVLRSKIGADVYAYSMDFYRLVVHVAYLNVIVGVPWYTPVFWTLAIEFQYYVAVALAFPLLSARDWRIRNATMLGLLCAYLPFRGDVSVWEGMTIGSLPWLPAYLPLFMTGVLLFQRSAGIIGGREFWLWSLAMIGASAAYSALMPLLSLVAVWVLLENRRHAGITDFLGRISYSLYLVHWPIGKPLQEILLPHVTNDAQRVALAVGVTAVCVLAAWVFYWLIEMPSLKLSKRIYYGARARVGRRDPSPAAAEPARFAEELTAQDEGHVPEPAPRPSW